MRRNKVWSVIDLLGRPIELTHAPEDAEPVDVSKMYLGKAIRVTCEEKNAKFIRNTHNRTYIHNTIGAKENYK